MATSDTKNLSLWALIISVVALFVALYGTFLGGQGLSARLYQGTGTVNVGGKGFLSAQGNGSATVTGQMTLTGYGSDGTLRVTNTTGTAAVSTIGQGTKTVIDESTTEYTGVGSFSVTGDATVEISGQTVWLSAQGTGTATLTGTGTVRTQRKQASWSPQGTTVSF